MSEGAIGREKRADERFCADCGRVILRRAEICPLCGVRQAPAARAPHKRRAVAAALALCLGWMGAHKFYLGQIGMGLTYLLFSWTGIPLLLSIVEGSAYLLMSDQLTSTFHGGSGCAPEQRLPWGYRALASLNALCAALISGGVLALCILSSAYQRLIMSVGWVVLVAVASHVGTVIALRSYAKAPYLMSRRVKVADVCVVSNGVMGALSVWFMATVASDPPDEETMYFYLAQAALYLVLALVNVGALWWARGGKPAQAQAPSLASAGP